jgi:hypothetical protein
MLYKDLGIYVHVCGRFMLLISSIIFVSHIILIWYVYMQYTPQQELIRKI